MKKRTAFTLLTLALLLCLCPVVAAGTGGDDELPEIPVDGNKQKCGDDLYWSFNSSTGTLTITGSGAMDDYASLDDQPWAAVRDQIKKISLPERLQDIGTWAFSGCRGLTNVTITPNRDNDTGYAVVTHKDNTRNTLYATQIAVIEQTAREAGIVPVVRDIPSDNLFMVSVLPTILIVVVCLFFFYMMNAQNMGGGSNAKMMNFGKSKARLARNSGVTLDDVAGLQEEKEDLEEIIDFLKDPGKYTKVGARIPKGVLLEGAPGTGKTLLAKAVAGEAGVPFFSISGSDFVEMFVGVGASRVRDMFDDAKKNSPCIVFIDEIDAVARRRGTGLGGSHDEREQTLNQLLVEMDGFGVNEGIIVMAATNRVDVLDPAILRPGRSGS